MTIINLDLDDQANSLRNSSLQHLLNAKYSNLSNEINVAKCNKCCECGKKLGVVVKVLLLLGIASIKNLSSFYY